jgi:cation diffusion facilitator CzcD-associated flavoprotein CzcO
VRHAADGEAAVACQVVVMANGLWVPNFHTDMRGGDLVTGYEELPPGGEIFEGKSVAVLGMGNSAFEIANAAADYANYVHIWPTRASGALVPCVWTYRARFLEKD